MRPRRTHHSSAEVSFLLRGQFDYRKRTAGIEPAELRSGAEAWPFAVYRLADVERLRTGSATRDPGR